MTLSAYLFISVLIGLPILINEINKKLFRDRYGKLAIAGAAAFLIYCIILLSVFAINIQLEAELNYYDLNGDGLFSGTEITPEQQEAMKRFVNDTGRTFAPFTGAVFAVLYFLVVLCFWYLATKLVMIVKVKRKNT